ncbi:UDP-N-acetylmuramoyl-tripeptide--D-alanyl-D-alanine ligase [Coralloluteibacterium thermophilus]|uniref:UDP-N-acetylmuramoyl-tripeptide--D-alanyl-D-alanine ligase n=1 Tax=Coralloluteibacterium thermophilum TaxID=2707049 RepID=A0ABV9NQF3_9GAMM
MRPQSLSRLATWCGGRLHGEDVRVSDVAIDSRAAGPASLFVALRGERADGHDFVASAGAAAALVERVVEAGVPQLVVGDTQAALGRIARGVQADRATRVLAVTGSNGKTTVKTLLAGILAHAGRTYANPGNRNNEIGLPLAVLEAPDEADFAVYEMGAGKPGDIAYLTDIVAPDVALVNNVAAAHLERMGSLLGIADTKAAIYRALRPGGTAVINADDAFAPWFATQAGAHAVLRFGIEASADVVATDIVPGAEGSRFLLRAPQGERAIALPLPGRHNVRNALAAAACALAAGAGLDHVAAGLAGAAPVPGRQVAHALSGGAVLVDDSYNANPASLVAAIDTLADQGGEAWLVLGDMKELGPEAEALHAECGARARARRIARLYATGALSAAAVAAFGPQGRHFHDRESLVAALRADLAAAATPPRVLVKGSRSSAMDRVVAALLPAAQPEDATHAA